MVIFVVLTGTFVVMAYRIAKTVRRESAIFLEFKQPKTLGWLVFLFPCGPVIYFVLSYRAGFIGLILMALCFLPGCIAAKKRISAFDRAGTDRVNRAKSAAVQAFEMSIVGFVYTASIFVLYMFTA